MGSTNSKQERLYKKEIELPRFLSFCQAKQLIQTELSVPSGLVLTVPSFVHSLVLRIPLSGTPSTTGR